MNEWHKQVDMFVYINLDDRKERRQQMQNVLCHDLQLPIKKVRRVSATRDQIGFRGCTRSHLDALRLVRKQKCRIACLLEDDFMPVVPAHEFSPMCDGRVNPVERRL